MNEDKQTTTNHPDEESNSPGSPAMASYVAEGLRAIMNDLTAGLAAIGSLARRNPVRMLQWSLVVVAWALLFRIQFWAGTLFEVFLIWWLASYDASEDTAT